VHGHAVTCPLHNKVVDLDGGEAQAPDSGCIRRRPAKLEAGRVPLALPA
jgi:nitrite reductase (NADH) small subunit